MEFNPINFEVLEECLMAAESKEYLQTVFTSLPIYSLDSEIFTVTSDNLPQNLKNLPKTLGVSNEKALTVRILPLTSLVGHFFAQFDERVHWDFNDG